MLSTPSDAVLHPIAKTDSSRVPRVSSAAIALTAWIGALGCTASSDPSIPTNGPAEQQATTRTSTIEEENAMTKATMIPMTAAPGQESDLRSFLKTGRDLVASGEPGTPYWYALKQEGRAGGFAIFDLFPDQAGRDAHFNGDVAAALASKAPELVHGAGRTVSWPTCSTTRPSPKSCPVSPSP